MWMDVWDNTCVHKKQLHTEACAFFFSDVEGLEQKK